MKKVYLEIPEAVIKALKEGKVVKSKNVKYRLIDGINGRTMWTVGNSIFEYEDAYIDEPEPLKIEVGKFYKTRDGRKARCYDVDSVVCYFTIDHCTCFTTDTNGIYWKGQEEDDLDIIAPWEE